MPRSDVSIALLTALAVNCGGRTSSDSVASGGTTVGNGGDSATGGVASVAGSSAVGGTASVQTSTTAAEEQNLATLTQDEWDQINANACAGWTAEGEPMPTNLLFIVDTSGSMGDLTSGNGNINARSNWDVARAAVQDAIDKLPAATSVGLLLWPNQLTVPNTSTTPYVQDAGVNACVNMKAMVPLAQLGGAGSQQRAVLTSALDAAVPQGGTPMADAYNAAIDQSYGNPLMLYKNAVLVTDGHPTMQLGCEGAGDETQSLDYQPVLDAIEGAFKNLDVRTFVVGTPGSDDQSSTGVNARPWLSAAAQAGNLQLTADCQNSGPNYCHFDMSNAANLSTGFVRTLQVMTGPSLSCTYRINDPGLAGQIIDPSRSIVIYQVNGSTALGDMKLIGQASDPRCPEVNGWYLDPNDPTALTIDLCPETCTMIQSDPGAIIDIRAYCSTIVIPN